MGMSKDYKADKLLKKSRYNNYLLTLNVKTIEKLIQRVDKLIKENPEYCDDGNIKHLANIFTAIALYDVLQDDLTKAESLDIVKYEMWKTVEKESEKFKKIIKIPYSLKILGILLPRMFSRGSGYGWEYRWHNDTRSNDYLQFECTSCIYQQIFNKYDMEELGPVFCHSDDINYGSLPGIRFTREHTLCVDGQECDFLFVRK